MAEGTSRKKTLRDFLRLVFRRRWMFIVGVSLFAFVSMVAAHFLQPKYGSSAMFERRTDDVAEGGDVADSLDTLKLMLRYELAGPRAAERVVEELGMTEGLPRGSDGVYTPRGEMLKQELAEKVQKSLRVSWRVRHEKIDLISVSYTDENPDLAYKLPNRIIKNYIERVSDQIQERLNSSREYLSAKVRAAERLLSESTTARINFEAEYQGRLPDEIGSFNQRITLIESDMETIRRQLDIAKQKRSQLASVLNPTTTRPVRTVEEINPERQKLEEELAALEKTEREWIESLKMKDKHPSMVRLRKRREIVKKRIKETPEKIVREQEIDPRLIETIRLTLAGVETEITVHENELQRLQRRLDGLLAVQANFAKIRQEYDKLLKREKTHRAAQDGLSQRLGLIEHALALEVSKRNMHWSQVQLARKQHRPSSPSLGMILGFAVVGGLVFGGGLVFLGHLLDRSVGTREDATSRFDIPVQGVIGEIVTPKVQRKRRLKRWIVTPLATLIVVICLGVSSTSLWLWLKDPESFKEWQASPTAFVYDRVVAPVVTVIDDAL